MEETGVQRKGEPTGTTRPGHRSDSVRGMGCEEKEKTWTVVWGSNPQEGQRGLGLIVLSSHDKNGENYRSMKEVVKG